jgi:phospholipid/cholesterol/gamma-HCH transport system substrate-binding protein
MKPFSERNHLTVGLVSIVLIGIAVWLSLNYNKFSLFNGGMDYSAYFAESGGLSQGSPVEVSGAKVGQVSSVALDGARVLVKFNVDGDIRIGEATEAAIKVKTLLGAKFLEVTPRGDGHQTGAIPLSRTTSPYELSDALGDLSTTIGGLNTDQLSNSLAVLANEFANTPTDLRNAVQGLGRFSQTLNDRDAQLRTLLDNANKVTKVLADRSDEVVDLVVNTNALLVELKTQSAALDQIFGNLSALAHQIKGFIAENRATLKPALEKVNGVLGIVDNRKGRIQEAIKGLNGFALSLGESVSSGPIFKAIVANLLPGQFIQPFIDAAFSDLGIDPATQLPSVLTDPQIGQPGTPPLPVPYPRTGQGGDPRLTLPDAITGKPGDPGCGPPGLPLPGPTGCYPYREPLPAPPPGGPPPGPPAQYPPLTEQPEPDPPVGAPQSPSPVATPPSAQGGAQ